MVSVSTDPAWEEQRRPLNLPQKSLDREALLQLNVLFILKGVSFVLFLYQYRKVDSLIYFKVSLQIHSALLFGVVVRDDIETMCAGVQLFGKFYSFEYLCDYILLKLWF